jgi:hypothetical protein
MTRTVDQLLSRTVGEDWTPVYVFGSTPAYWQDGSETGPEQAALHTRAVAVHANERRQEELLQASEREAAQPPNRAYFDAAFLRIHERIDNLEAALAARGPE